MSRIRVFDLHGVNVAEFTGFCSRGYSLAGNASVTPGGSATVNVSDDVAENDWLQLGRILLVEHPKLPPWAGMIDTPWKATSPVQITAYNAEYLLSLRTPDNPFTLGGSVFDIAAQLLNLANGQEEMYVRMGETRGNGGSRLENISQRPIWAQLNDILTRAGVEMVTRPDGNGDRLYIYLDFAPTVGQDTGFLLHDGQGANMQINEARVDGVIVNRLIGIGAQSTASSQKITPAFVDIESRNTYRLRSQVVQYASAIDDATLQNNALADLAYRKRPRLLLRVSVLDVEDTFSNLRPGNTMLLHAANLSLPGGVKGFRGNARILAMDYNEEGNSVSMNLEAAL